MGARRVAAIGERGESQSSSSSSPPSAPASTSYDDLVTAAAILFQGSVWPYRDRLGSSLSHFYTFGLLISSLAGAQDSVSVVLLKNLADEGLLLQLVKWISGLSGDAMPDDVVNCYLDLLSLTCHTIMPPLSMGLGGSTAVWYQTPVSGESRDDLLMAVTMLQSLITHRCQQNEGSIVEDAFCTVFCIEGLFEIPTLLLDLYTTVSNAYSYMHMVV